VYGSCYLPFKVSREDCLQAGRRIVASSDPDAGLGASCGGGATLRGFVASDAGMQLCCD
jgi:hypothetical protein